MTVCQKCRHDAEPGLIVTMRSCWDVTMRVSLVVRKLCRIDSFPCHASLGVVAGLTTFAAMHSAGIAQGVSAGRRLELPPCAALASVRTCGTGTGP